MGVLTSYANDSRWRHIVYDTPLKTLSAKLDSFQFLCLLINFCLNLKIGGWGGIQIWSSKKSQMFWQYTHVITKKAIWQSYVFHWSNGRFYKTIKMYKWVFWNVLENHNTYMRTDRILIWRLICHISNRVVVIDRQNVTITKLASLKGRKLTFLLQKIWIVESVFSRRLFIKMKQKSNQCQIRWENTCIHENCLKINIIIKGQKYVFLFKVHCT